MISRQTQSRFSNNPPLLSPSEVERENYHLCFNFEYGTLDDGTLWVRTPSKGLFNVDWLTLRVLLELNAGAHVTPLTRKYKIDIAELRKLLLGLEREKAIVQPREGKITKARVEEDINIIPFVFLFFILTFIQIGYFQDVARTFRLRLWHEMLLIGIISILPIILHELGHYFVAKRYFTPHIGFTHLFIFPAVYVDTHAAWCLPRNIRLLINSAGILMDLIFNTLLILLVAYHPHLEYYVTPILIIQFTRWSIILNPLVAGDGYWLLADFSRTINLRQKGRESIRQRRFHWLSLYGLLSLIFSVFSILGLLWFIINLLGLGTRFFV